MVINIYSDVTMYYFRRLGIFRTHSIRNLQYPIDDYISKGVYILKVHAFIDIRGDLLQKVLTDDSSIFTDPFCCVTLIPDMSLLRMLRERLEGWSFVLN